MTTKTRALTALIGLVAGVGIAVGAGQADACTTPDWEHNRAVVTPGPCSGKTKPYDSHVDHSGEYRTWNPNDGWTSHTGAPKPKAGVNGRTSQ